MGKWLFGNGVHAHNCSPSPANLQVQLIGMEASSGAHFLGKALRAQGHDVRLMPAQYVKPYVKTNKSDYIDAEAIAEAVQRPRMRFVPIKTEEQLDLQALHRVRERWVMRRTAVVNQIRSLLHAASCCICSLMDSCASGTSASWPIVDVPQLATLFSAARLGYQTPSAEQDTSGACNASDLWLCPKCAGPMVVVERLTAPRFNFVLHLWSPLPHETTLDITNPLRVSARPFASRLIAEQISSSGFFTRSLSNIFSP